MTHIKRFFESSKFHSRLSVEQIEDFFLEFVEAGDIHFYHSGIPTGQTYVAVYFILDRKFNTITDSESMSRLTQLLKRVSDVCTRWKLDWEFKLIAIGNKPGGGGPMQTQLEIRQPVPKIVLDQFPGIITPHFDIQFESRKYRFDMWLNHDELTMDFYIIFEPDTTRAGSGQYGEWLKPDWIYFNRYEKDIMNKLQEEYSKVIPCQYVDKKGDGDVNWGFENFLYRFKLLV